MKRLMKRLATRLLLSALLVLLPTLASAQMGSVPNLFAPSTPILSAEVNTNFSTLYSNALNRTGGTMTGVLNTLNILPTVDDSYSLGSTSLRWTKVWGKDLDFTGTTQAVGTITSGIWNAGAITSSGNVADSVGSMATIRTSITTLASQSAQSLPVSGRLTLESGVPISTTNQSAKTTLYFTPFRGNQIALFDGTSVWNTVSFTELSISIAACTASKPYDVFIYNNSGTATLETLVWTNTTTRATGITTQNGVYVKSGATTRRYVGSYYCNGTGGQTDDTLTKAYVWNYYNRTERPLVLAPASTWTYFVSNTWRQANGSTANQVEILVGIVEDKLRLDAFGYVTADGSVLVNTGIGIDSTTATSTTLNVQANIDGNVTYGSPKASLYRYTSLGLHVYPWLERISINSGSTATWYGAAGDTQLGLFGQVAR